VEALTGVGSFGMSPGLIGVGPEVVVVVGLITTGERETEVLGVGMVVGETNVGAEVTGLLGVGGVEGIGLAGAVGLGFDTTVEVLGEEATFGVFEVLDVLVGVDLEGKIAVGRG